MDFTNLHRKYWPQEGYSKGDLLYYYGTMGSYLLRYLKDRPYSIRRFPRGITGTSFYQKHVPSHAPSWLRQEVVPGKDDREKKVCFVGGELEDILWLANQGAIEFHGGLSRWDTPDEAELCVLDLDPGPNTSNTQLMDVIRAIKKLLDILDVQGFLKTSGGRGFHVYIPLLPNVSFQESQGLAEGIGRIVQGVFPRTVAVHERRVENRKDCIYIDYLQNGRGRTMVAPYSLRSLSGAPVSLPLIWEELNKELVPSMWNIDNVPPRVRKRGDPFAEMPNTKQCIKRALAWIAGQGIQDWHLGRDL